jgi:hypothetical protein
MSGVQFVHFQVSGERRAFGEMLDCVTNVNVGNKGVGSPYSVRNTPPESVAGSDQEIRSTSGLTYLL